LFLYGSSCRALLNGAVSFLYLAESRLPTLDDLTLIENIGPVRKAKRDFHIDLGKYRHDVFGRLSEHDGRWLRP
jgi:hypothetical protein